MGSGKRTERSDGEGLGVPHTAELTGRSDVVPGPGVLLTPELKARETRTAEVLGSCGGLYRTMFELMDEGFCLIQVLFGPDGKAYDYRFLEANAAFTKHTGLASPVGRTVRELLPDYDAHRFEVYGKVALTGEPTRFDTFGKALGRHYEAFAFRVGQPHERTVAVLFRDESERVRATAGLRESEEFNRSVVQNTSAVILRLDPQWRITFANQRALEFFGYSAEELLGQFALGRVVPARDSTGQDMEQMLRDIGRNPELLRSHTNENMRKNGERVWLEWTNSGIYDGEGRLKEILSVGIDITERKQAEEERSRAEAEVRRARERSELLSRTISRLLASPDPQKIIHELCEEVRSFLKCDIFLNFLFDGATNQPRLNVCGGLDAEQVRDLEAFILLAQARRAGTDGSTVCPAGNHCAIEAVRAEMMERLKLRAYACHPLLGPDNTVIGTLAFGARDRTAFTAEDVELMKAVADHVVMAVLRRQSEEAVRRLSQRLQGHIQNTPLAVIEFDSQMRVRGWNDGAYRVFGWEASEVVGRQIGDIPWLCGEDRSKARRISAELQTGSTPRSVSLNRNVRKDGKVIWCEWHNSSLNDASGRMESVQALVLDVTDRKEAQEVLARNKEGLERLVAERTAELQDLVGELEHFSYSITHDMRAPLRAIMGFAEVVKELCAPCAQQPPQLFLNRITDAARRMDLLITDALNYSKAVRNELPLAPVDVGRLIRGMVDTYPELQADQARIFIAPDLPLVMGNEAGLTQCFSNLLENAVKFGRPGEPAQVRVWSEMRGGWVRIWVEDEGIGISTTMLPRVFDMFSRGGSDKAGTGIGLALVRKVVNRMGGRVGVESEEGRGSRFWVELKPGLREVATESVNWASDQVRGAREER